MLKKMPGVMKTVAGSVTLLFLIVSLFAGCSGGGGGGGGVSGGGGKTSDADLKKIADELVALGKGHWEITTLEREGDVVNISFKVGDDPGKVTFKEGQAAEEVVHKILPKASGKLSWISVQGVGLRTVLLEPSEGGPAAGGGGEQPAQQSGGGEHQGGM